MKKIVVVVEEVEVARTALQWALHNLINYGDLIILLHVFPSSSSSSPKRVSSSSSSRNTNNNNNHNKKQRVLRLKGFHLALSFKLVCDHTIPDAKVDIVVREGDQDGTTIASTVREIGASALVVGIHDQSFLYKMMAMTNTTIINNLNCRVLAIKQPMETTTTTSVGNSINFDFSQIEIGRLSLPPIPPQKIPYQILPSPFRIIWRSKRTTRRKDHQQQSGGC